MKHDIKNILILGACGGIGRYCVDYFYDRREEFNISLLSADIHRDSFVEARSEFYQMDISDKEAWMQIPTNIYAIIDFATTMPARMEGYDPGKYIRVNIEGTYNVLEFCRKNSVNRLLFAQTFGDILAYAEEDPVLKIGMTPKQDYTDNKSVYITTMNTAVELIKCYNAVFYLRTFLFRLPTIYSWHEKPYFENGVEKMRGWRLLIQQATDGEDIHVWGDPTRKKDMVYVKDLCQMFYKACFIDRDFGFYNVGTGIGISLLDQIKGMVEVFGENRKSKLIMAPEMPNAPQYIMCIDEAVKDLGYQPEYSYIEMLRDMKKERDLNRFGQ